MSKTIKKKLKSINSLILDGESLSKKDVFLASHNFDLKIAVSKKTQARIEASRELLEQLVNENRVIYGVNTGVGGFVNWLIPSNSAEKLQENLISAVAT